MSNQVALSIAGLLIALGLADTVLNDGETLLYLARKLAKFIEYLAFWR